MSITSHLFCVRHPEWVLQTRNGIPYCTCGAPLTDELREYAETLRRLLFPALHEGTEPATLEGV